MSDKDKFNIKDRGIKKWQPASFIPEQMDLLKKMHHEAMKISLPELDEYELQEINPKMANAFEKRIPVNLKLLFNGIKEWEGPVILKKIDALNNRIKVEYNDKTVKMINIENIIGIEYE